MIVGFLAITVSFVLPVRPLVSMESRSSAMPEVWDNAVPRSGTRPFKIFTTLAERTVKLILADKLTRDTKIPNHTYELYFSFPQECRACEGVDLYYTLHRCPKNYRIVCLVFVSALAELTKSLTLSLVAYRPPSPEPIKVRQQPLAPTNLSIGSLIRSALISPSSSSNCLLLFHITLLEETYLF